MHTPLTSPGQANFIQPPQTLLGLRQSRLTLFLPKLYYPNHLLTLSVKQLYITVSCSTPPSPGQLNDDVL